jgi:phosphatidate cytidylyltransferase
MKNVLVRSLSGLFLIIVVIASVWLNSLTNYLLFLFILIFGLFEFYRFTKAVNFYPNEKIGIAIGIIIYTLSYLIASKVLPINLFSLIIPLILFIPIIELYRQKKNPILNVSITFFGLAYIVLPLSLIHFMVLGTDAIKEETDIISNLSQASALNIYYSPFIIIGYFIIQWVSDTGAFVFGVTLGKHRLFERISPKKSWEGAIGGFIATIGAAFFVHYLFPELNLSNWIIISLIITFFGIYGDLIESLFKRSVNVKDSGKIMPGHGGILDRFDSTFIALPMVYFYLQIINYL